MVGRTNEIKSNRGITLIVLAITVIVMLILVGVVLNYAIGEGGLIGRAEDASNRYQKAEENEIALLNKVEQKYDNVLNRIGGSNIEEMPLPSSSTVPIKGVIESAKGKKFENTTTLTEETGKQVTIPGGFTITEDSATKVEEGIVIKDEKGNEYVWVEVLNPTTMYVEENVKLSGVNVTTNRYSKLRGIIGEEENYVADKPGSTVETNVREPDLLTSTNADFNATNENRGISQIKNVLGITGTTDEEVLTNYATSLVQEYNAMLDSVIQYRGFYIGRYELTGTVDNPASKPGTVLTNQNWYSLKKACNNIINNQYVQSCMIYGCQWEEVMSWLIASKSKQETEVYTDSREWGNYNDSIGNAAINSGSKRDTGLNETCKANNIYDLAGNCWAWTQEAYEDNGRVGRGGSAGLSGTSRPAATRNHNGTYFSHDVLSSRPTLIIK